MFLAILDFRAFLITAALAVIFTTNPVTAQNCNYVTLVKCFINILDEWTWTLYELKDNVVTINQDQCEHLRQLDKCIQDDGPEPHECNHNEIVAASNTVSQELLNEHRSCLSRERIGEMTLSAGTYLSEKFLEHPDEEVCPEVNNKLQEYMDAMSGLCEEEASQIMCKSLTNMFKGLHADKLHNCHFNCLRQLPTDSSNHHVHQTNLHQQQEDVVPGQAEPADGGDLNSAKTNTFLLTHLLLFVTATFLLMR
ncbi:hypothetical protein Ddc_05888 [Ditylenchus destructor]|nr:hypothetical protein Ddc_05888 [Ditylenchus destructor]